jgi:hypothetical protein
MCSCISFTTGKSETDERPLGSGVESWGFVILNVKLISE